MRYLVYIYSHLLLWLQPQLTLTDGVGRGSLWKKIFTKHCESIKLIDPLGKDILVGSRNNLYQSLDGGNSWNKLFEVPLNYLT